MTNLAAYYALLPMQSETAEIARGLRRRDPELLDRLIEQYQHRLFRYLLHLTGNRQLAEDIFQETWLRVLERGGQYDGAHSFVSWLLRVARNLTIDSLRRMRPASLDALADPEDDSAPFEPADRRATPFEELAAGETRDHMVTLLASMPTAYREVLMLRFQEEMPLEEIAAVLNTPLGTVKSRLYRAMELMRDKLENKS
jgi:RNA polymerase sigma-70 factor (ECF subfamily)